MKFPGWGLCSSFGVLLACTSVAEGEHGPGAGQDGGGPLEPEQGAAVDAGEAEQGVRAGGHGEAAGPGHREARGHDPQAGERAEGEVGRVLRLCARPRQRLLRLSVPSFVPSFALLFSAKNALINYFTKI